MEIFLFVSFITGVISILSPCILPVLPIFIGFNLKKRKNTEIISFVLGLFAIFIIILFATVYFTDDRSYDDFDDILDDFMCNLADEDEFKDLSDEDYEETVKKYIEENVRHYKAIVISTGD